MLGSSVDDEQMTEVFAHWKAWIFRDLPFAHVVCVFVVIGNYFDE
jgi:hypothetical protein